MTIPYEGLDDLPEGSSELSRRFWDAWQLSYPHLKLKCEFCDIEGWKESLAIRKQSKPRSRMWRADFAYIPAKVIIEINGGTFAGGNSKHSSGVGISRDYQKVLWAAVDDWLTVSLSTDMLAKKRIYDTVDLVARVIASRIGFEKQWKNYG